MGNHRAAIVVGAGISGLVCAYRLKTLGNDVLLIEKSDRVGGLCKTDVREGFHFDETGHWLHLRDPDRFVSGVVAA